MALPLVQGTAQFLSAIDRATQLRATAFARAASLPVARHGGPVQGAATGPVVLSAAEGRQVVRRALDAAGDILADLKQLQGRARLGADPGVLAAVPDVSRGSLQIEAEALVARLDAAVAGAGAFGANLVQGGGANVRIATSGLGGSMLAVVQGLDSRSLGVDRLDLSTDAGIADAISRIGAALADATVKLEVLQGYSLAIGAAAQLSRRPDSTVASAAFGSLASAAFGGLASAAFGSLAAGTAGYGGDGGRRDGAATRGLMVDLRA